MAGEGAVWSVTDGGETGQSPHPPPITAPSPSQSSVPVRSPQPQIVRDPLILGNAGPLLLLFNGLGQTFCFCCILSCYIQSMSLLCHAFILSRGDQFDNEILTALSRWNWPLIRRLTLQRMKVHTATIPHLNL